MKPLSPEAIAVIEGRHADPFRYLGPQVEDGRPCLRVFIPDAKRITALWETNNPTSTAQTSVSVLFGQPAEYGISTDLLFAMQKLKF